MSQIDNRNSSAAKRARTDGMTTCNMRNCTQSRPADHNSKSIAKSPHAPHGYSSSAAYMGSAVPSSMYLTPPPYGSSLFNGASLPPYNLSFSGGSGYQYDYGNRLSAGSPYGPLHLSAPSPYSGGMYGVPPPPMMDRYGLGLAMGHAAAMGARQGVYPNETPPKKSADTIRDSDWTCPNCGNVNFSFRTVCNMRKCNTPKPGSQTSKAEKSSKSKMPEGSWKCGKCNNINFPFRTKCNRQNCGADKPSESNESPRAEASGEDDQSLELFAFSLWLFTMLLDGHPDLVQMSSCWILLFLSGILDAWLLVVGLPRVELINAPKQDETNEFSPPVVLLQRLVTDTQHITKAVSKRNRPDFYICDLHNLLA
ncbi:hypothetical protein IFM89_030792 [Coptis chinensis]|uniref:RanBP2-type domain-containing protein n=1 Tax=Coptis chinensis TaxID=261450 RepID=A0A835IHG0_9MAGN|nr:hypothetical protein IFM89_030792 [Coptis chinensis]